MKKQRTLKEYNEYRQQLINQGIYSFIDFNGNVYSACIDCKKEKCALRDHVFGCMKGALDKEIFERIRIDKKEK